MGGVVVGFLPDRYGSQRSATARAHVTLLLSLGSSADLSESFA